MSKYSSAKYYQDNQKILQKSLWKISKSFLRRKGKKAIIWLWKVQTSLRRWKTKAGWV